MANQSNLLVVACVLIAPLSSQTADARDPKTDTHREASPSCELTGNAHVARKVALLSKASATPVAMFTGMPVELAISEFPTRKRAGLEVATRTGFQLEGIVEDPRQVRLFTRELVPVRPGVWVASGTEVRFVDARRGELRVQVDTVHTTEPLEVWAPCGSFALDQRGLEETEPPGGALPYLTNQRRITFFSSPTSSSTEVVSLTRPAYSDGLLLWGTHEKNGFLRAYYQDDIAVEAWVDRSLVDRTNVARDQRPTRTKAARQLPNLEIVRDARLFESTRVIPIRVKPSMRARPVGIIEKGTEVLVTDETRSGWAAVLPKALDVVGPNGTSFWVPAREVAELPTD